MITDDFSGKHIIEDCKHHSDRICQFTFLFNNETV